MSTITFDTHKFIRKLRDAGFDEKQAEAVADAFQEAQSEVLPVTRDYLDARLFELENRPVKWGIGFSACTIRNAGRIGKTAVTRRRINDKVILL